MPYKGDRVRASDGVKKKKLSGDKVTLTGTWYKNK